MKPSRNNFLCLSKSRCELASPRRSACGSCVGAMPPTMSFAKKPLPKSTLLPEPGTKYRDHIGGVMVRRAR